MALGSAYAFVGSTPPPSALFSGPGFLAPANARAASRSAARGGEQSHYFQLHQSRRARSGGVGVGGMLGSLNMSSEAGDSSSEKSDVTSTTQKLLERAAQARAEAEELEIKYRKEQGLEDFVPTGAKVSAVGAASDAADTAAAATAVTPKPAVVLKSTPETRAALVAKLAELPEDSKAVITKMEELKTEGLAPRWNSFDFGKRYQISQGQLKMQTGLDGTSLAADGGDMEDLKYALGAVCAFSFIAAVGVGSAIGGNVGASFTYFFALLPIVFLGIGSTAPGVITAVINSVKRKSQEDYEERRVRHEAAHFLSGYLCGLPIKSYRADGGTTLVEFYDSVDGDMNGRALKFTAEEVDKVSIVAMSGAVGEAQQYGTATGGAGDLDNLGQIMNQTNPPMDGKEQQSQARWATLQAHRLLSSHDAELRSLMQAFREAKPVSECVAALEGARAE